jgi:hypothetical protein
MPHERVWKSRGTDVFFEDIISIHGIPVRITIRRNFYAYQSFARAELFDKTTLSWHRVASIPHPLMKTNERITFTHGPLPSLDQFEEDNETLKDEVRFLLDLAGR